MSKRRGVYRTIYALLKSEEQRRDGSEACLRSCMCPRMSKVYIVHAILFSKQGPQSRLEELNLGLLFALSNYVSFGLSHV